MMVRHAFVFMLVLVGLAPARAQQSVADFYKGKSIDLYIGLSAGGVYDISARLLSRHMGAYIPGNPSILPRQMEGAAGLRLANWLYQLGPKDGTAIGTFARGSAFDLLLGIQGATFDPTKYNWIGSTNDEVSICAAWHTTGITKMDQLYENELILGSTGGSGDDEQFPKLIRGVLGVKLRTVSGYPGGNEIKMAMERGEVNGRCGWSWSSVKATQGQWLKDKAISIFVQLSLHRQPDVPDVPMIMDLARTEEERQIFKLMFARQVMAWPFVAPPGVPTERVDALRKAFDNTMKDRDFLAEAERLGLEITPVSGEKMNRLISEIYESTPPVLAAKVAEMIK